MLVSDNKKEEVITHLDELVGMLPQSRTWIVKEQNKKQLANQKMKVGFTTVISTYFQRHSGT